MEHSAESDGKPQNRGHLAEPGADKRRIPDSATASSSQAGNKLSPLPSGPLGLATSTESLPIWAQWSEPPLLATQVEHVRNRMRLPTEYLSMGPNQRNKAVADDLSAALRSMCKTFNQSIKFHWKYVGKLKQEFLRPRSDEVGRSKSTPGSELNAERQATVSVTSRLIRANSTYSADSSLSEKAGGSEDPSRKRRKLTETSSRQVHLGHHEDVVQSSPGVALIPRRDESHSTTNLQTTEELLKLMSKRKHRSNEKEGFQRYTSLRSSISHTAGSEKPDLPNKSKSPSLPALMSDRHKDAERDVEKKNTVKIPADTKMATDLRAYSQWPDDSGALVIAQGCLLPARYRLSSLPGFEWICPVRTCQRCYGTQKSLGSHFSSLHHSCLLNDNCDGTFTVVGKYKWYGTGNRRSPRVKTKNPLPEDASPPVEARPPATWVTVREQQRFATIKEGARVDGRLNLREEKTVDELMLLSSSSVHSSAEALENSELSDASRALPSLDVEECSFEPEASSSHGFSRPKEVNSEDENSSHTSGHDEVKLGKEPFVLSDAKQENWSLVGKFLDGRQSFTPKRGHFATLLSSPRSRDIVTRPGVGFIADQPKKVRLLMVHMTGEEPPVPCNSCALGRGPFEKCVSISKKGAGETTNGIVCCTNCASNRNLQLSCNVEELLSQPPAAQVSSPHKEHKKHKDPESTEQVSSGISSQITKVDSHFTLAVHFLKMDGSLELDAAPSGVRLCSLTTGKVLVELQGNSPFLMGAHGMFKIMPTIGARISNATKTGAILHVSTVKS